MMKIWLHHGLGYDSPNYHQQIHILDPAVTATLCEWDSALTISPSDIASATDMISIKIGRRTADVADTYGADIYFTGLMLEFIKTTGSWSTF